MNDQLAERLCIALEQIALELSQRPYSPPVAAPVAAAAPSGPFPPIGGGQPAAPWVCPVHGTNRVQPAGAVLGSPQVSKAGKPYTAFLVCGDYDCKEKPPKGMPAAPLRAVPASEGIQGRQLP